MSKARKLYLDSEGVKRGYYAYVHREKDKGEVFYVGKGHGRRAWETTGRNDLWLEKTASLGDGWEVVIIEDDLSEIEAFELEETLVWKYGGPASTGGDLTNWIPGGEPPAPMLPSLGLAHLTGCQPPQPTLQRRNVFSTLVRR